MEGVEVVQALVLVRRRSEDAEAASVQREPLHPHQVHMAQEVVALAVRLRASAL